MGMAQKTSIHSQTHASHLIYVYGSMRHALLLYILTQEQKENNILFTPPISQDMFP